MTPQRSEAAIRARSTEASVWRRGRARRRCAHAGENVAGAREVLRLRFWIDGRQNRDGAIGSANPRVTPTRASTASVKAVP